MPGVIAINVDKRLKRIVSHARSAPQHLRTDAQIASMTPPKPQLWLVHTRGVFITSNGKDSTEVSYAKGCDPFRDNNCTDNSSSIMGKIRVAAMDLEAFERAILRREKQIMIRVTNDGARAA